MHEHTLGLLDFYRIRESVAGYCLSQEGRALVNTALPLDDEAAVTDLKNVVEPVCRLIREHRGAPSGTFAPVEEALRVISKPGTTLEVEELWALGVWADAFGRLIVWLGQADDSSLRDMLRDAPDLAAVVAIAFRIVGPDGEIRDLPELADIRSRIRRINQDIEKATAGFFQNEAYRGMLQNDVPTQRDGRTVLAVRAGAKARIEGIVHEVSSTGQTVYIEPARLVERNNQLVEEEARYQRELARILRDATAKLHGYAAVVTVARTLCSVLDGLYARARYSVASSGVWAELSDGGFNLVAARHPILGSSAVPIDLRMPADARVIIITGPNTGGKTVSLKTAGLLALMNQFGLAIPAAEGSTMPVFDGVWADIGDEQSMDQSLSTFSGHMKAIAAITGNATGKSLVLLDELGSGTDPEEGSAIAMAILDRCIGAGAITLVTTHHGILKNYGYTRERVLNASVDFDRNTLSPTYRIVMGIPGESRALDIASRNGVSADIVDIARSYLRDERADISALIRGLSEKHRELDTMRDEERTRLRAAMEEQRKADLRHLKLRQHETELKAHGVAELKTLLSESRRTLENLVRELREGELTKARMQEVKDFLSDLDGRVAAADDNVRAEQRELRALSRQSASSASGGQGTGSGGDSGSGAAGLHPGGAVLVLPARRRGILVRKQKKGVWLVETDSLRIAVDEVDLEPTVPLEVRAPTVSVEKSGSGSGHPVFELDLRGYRLADAVAALEKQLDAALLAGLNGFSVIHGTGEGVLQEGVRQTLGRMPGVKDFHYARPEEGGHGKTIVTLGS